MWYSDLSQDVGPHSNPELGRVFQKLAPLAVSSTGTVTLPMMKADEIYTLTTLKTGRKGAHTSVNESSGSGLPMPYHQSFDDEQLNKPGKLWYAQMGAWEVQDVARPRSVSSDWLDLATAATIPGEELESGRELRQMATTWPNCWASQSCSPPKTWFGKPRQQRPT